MGHSQVRRPKVGFLHWRRLYDLSKEGYAYEMYCTFQKLAAEASFDLKTLCASPDEEALPYPDLNQVHAERFDAIISNGIWNPDFLFELGKLKIPVVSCDQETTSYPIDSVVFSSRQSGEMIGRILTQSGHLSVQFVSRYRKDTSAPAGVDPYIEDSTSAERRTGVQAGLLGTETDFWPSLPWIDKIKGIGVRAFVKQRLDLFLAEMGGWPEAMVFSDSAMSESIRADLQERGLQVPRDVSMVTFDASPEGHPSVFSHIQYSWTEMARETWRLLNERIDGQRAFEAPAVHVELPGTYVDRGTVADRRKRPTKTRP